MYRMFYNYETTGDTLFILLNTEKETTRSVTTGDVVALYSDDELVGINIMNLSKVLKIRAHGMIVTPGEELVNVVNSIIKRAKLETLPYCTFSGYRVGEVKSIDKDIIAIDMEGKLYTAKTNYNNIKVRDLVVLSLNGTIQYDGTTFRDETIDGTLINCHICNAEELRIKGNADEAFIVDGYKTGEDFYLAGE